MTVRSDAGPVEALGGVGGGRHVLAVEDGQDPFLVDRTGRYHGLIVAPLKPAGTEQIASVVPTRAEEGGPVVH